MGASIKHLQVIILSFFGYFLFAKIGLLFAIPPGFASAIWPAAGIGMAAYLIAGRWSLLGVGLASWLANFQVSYDPLVQTFSAALLLPFMISIGTVLQLLVAKRLISKFCSLPIKNTHLTSVIKFLILLGPISCLVASTFNTAVIAYINDLTFSHSLFIGFTWWIGDFLGVVFFAPIVLSLFKNKFYHQKTDKLKVAIPALMMFLLVSTTFALSRASYEDSRQEQFVRVTTGFSQQLNLIENTVLQQLVAMKGLFLSSREVTRDEFKAFAESLHNPSIKIRALAWLPKVDHAHRAEYESTISQHDFEGFSLKQIIDGKMAPAIEQKYYLPILYTEPEAPNRAAIGLDVSTHPIVGESVQKAIKTGKQAVSSQLSLAQQMEKFNAVIVYYPHYKNGIVPDTIAEREANLLGVFEAVLELDQLVLSMYNKKMEKDFVFQTQYIQESTTTAFFNVNYRSDGNFKFERGFPFFDTDIQVLFSSSIKFDKESLDWSSWLIVVVGCLVSTFSVIFIIIMTNLSEMLEDKVKLKTQQLSEKNDELIRANEAKSRFLANMSHEYRTPLNAILGFAQLGKNNKEPEKSEQFFDQILSSSKLLLGIINNVLDFSKMSEQQIELEKAPICVNASVDSVENLLQGKAQEKGLKLEVNKSGLGDFEVVGDSVRLTQIMMNLIDNAIKFTAAGKVTLSVLLDPISDKNGHLTIIVQDQGIGIPRTRIDSLFESFTQADDSTTRRFGGTGLGLAIVKQLTEKMNGLIEVDSFVGTGTKFTVQIPVQLIALKTKSDSLDGKEITKAQFQKELEQIRQKNFTALIVEDNKINQMIASKQLELLNITSSTADNGEEGLIFLADNRPDIMFVDLHMPILDGFSMIKKAKAVPEYANIPMVIISASVSKEDKELAKALGITDYVTKPFLLEDLENAVHRLLLQKSQQ